MKARVTLDDLANAVRAHDFRVVIEPTPDGQFEVSLATRDGSFMRAVRPALAEAIDIAIALHVGVRVPIVAHPEHIVWGAPGWPAPAKADEVAKHAFVAGRGAYRLDLEDDRRCMICGERGDHALHALPGAPTPENGPTS